MMIDAAAASKRHACPACGTSPLRLAFVLPGRDAARILRCPACRLLTRTDAGAAEVSWEYYDDQLMAYRRDIGAWHRRRARQRLELITREAMRGRLLEIGCGSGEFLQVAASAGFQVEGLEPSPALARVAASENGCLVHQASLESLESDRAFDWIVVFNVFEYIAEPCPALDKLASLLAPDGRLAMILANPDGWVNRALGRFAPNLAHCTMYHHYPPGAIEALLAPRFIIDVLESVEPAENAFAQAYGALGTLAPLFRRAPAAAPASPEPSSPPAGGLKSHLRTLVRRAPIATGRILSPLTWPLRALAGACRGGHETWLVARARVR